MTQFLGFFCCKHLVSCLNTPTNCAFLMLLVDVNTNYYIGNLITFKIVVVPDSAAAQKVPAVPGLLEYRNDNKKLYVRSNETWNEIGEEKKVILMLLCHRLYCSY